MEWGGATIIIFNLILAMGKYIKYFPVVKLYLINILFIKYYRRFYEKFV